MHVHLTPSLDGVVAGSSVAVDGDEAHHAVAVRRLRVGEQVVLTDGRGVEVRGAVTATGKRAFSVSVESRADLPEPEPRLVVVQAIPKGDRGELAVTLLTEIGVARVVPWAAERSVAVWRGERAARSLARWRSSAREAAKQSRRVWHPVVSEPATTDQVARLCAVADLAVVLHEGARRPLTDLRVPAQGEVVVVVGPEGGLSDDELAAYVDAGAHAVRLGPEVLRTSTAGLAAASALLSRTARWH